MHAAGEEPGSAQPGAAEPASASAVVATHPGAAAAVDEPLPLLLTEDDFLEPLLGADHFAAKALAEAKALEAAGLAASPTGRLSDGDDNAAQPQTPGVRQGAETLYCFDMDLTLLNTVGKSKWE